MFVNYFILTYEAILIATTFIMEFSQFDLEETPFNGVMASLVYSRKGISSRFHLPVTDKET